VSARASRLLAVACWLGLLAAWWTVAALDRRPGSLWPSPPTVVQAMWDGRVALLQNAAVTMTEAGLGFAAGTALAVAVALLADRVRVLGDGLQQLALALYSLPLIALAPVLVLWVGTGLATKVIIAALASFFPVLINLAQALRSTDPQALELMRVSGAGSLETFRRVELPYALPPLFAAFTIAGPSAIVGAMLAEWVGAERGLGLMVLFSMTSYDVPAIWSSLVVASLLSLAVYFAFALLGRALFPWHPSVRPVRAEG
jgi:ABC-type nitrate/sulfonate/bicarbonate transport system permease component